MTWHVTWPRWRTAGRWAGPVDQRGMLTIWMLGLCVCLLVVGGAGVDLWRCASERQQLASTADAAALAGASQIDLASFRSDGRPVLDPATARARATAYLADARARDGSDIRATVDASEHAVAVQAEEDVDLILLDLLHPGKHVHLTARSTAAPRTSP